MSFKRSLVPFGRKSIETLCQFNNEKALLDLDNKHLTGQGGERNEKVLVGFTKNFLAK